MSLNNNQFTVRWIDQHKKEHEKSYSNYDEAQKAYKWLVVSGADGVDIAIVQRVSQSKADVDEKMDNLPYKD